MRKNNTRELRICKTIALDVKTIERVQRAADKEGRCWATIARELLVEAVKSIK